MRAFQVIVALTLLAAVVLADADETLWEDMIPLSDLDEDVTFMFNPENIVTCKIATENETFRELRCRFEKPVNVTDDETEDEEIEVDDETEVEEIDVYGNAYTCPSTEKEALYEIWTKANGPSWTNAGEAGWKKFNKPMKHWKEACDAAPDATGAYYASNYDGIQCKDGYIVDIQLSDNNMKGKLSKAIGCFEYAKHINLSHNKLKKRVPGTISMLKNALQDLDIQDNKFTKVGKAICANEDICKSLYIADNPWIKTPDCLEDMKTSCPANDIP